MAKLSKKQKVMAGKIESDKNYAIEEAVSLITAGIVAGISVPGGPT